jgi:dienelactone hydrolase
VDADGGNVMQLVLRDHRSDRQDNQVRQQPWNTFALWGAGPRRGDEIWAIRSDGIQDKRLAWFALLRLNTRTARVRELDLPRRSYDWLFDAQDRLRGIAVAEGEIGERGSYRIRDAAGGPWQEVSNHLRAAPVLPALPDHLAPDGRWFTSASEDNRDTRALFVWDAETRKPAAKPLLESPHFDLHPDFVETDTALLGVRMQLDAEVTHWFDPAMRDVQAEVDRQLPATSNRVVPPRRGDSPWLLVEAFADVHPRRWFAFHRGNRRLVAIGGQRPEIDAARMGTMDLVRVKARDGLEIPCYVTLPPGMTMASAKAAGRKLPLVVDVHGGPHVRGATWEWQPMVQFLATRGYAVLQPQFRGSTGFGRKHLLAGLKQWGLAMQDDLADCARWAVGEGIADAKRIAIAGASYGGYAALMGLVKDADLFRCAVCQVGVSDLELLFSAGWSDAGEVDKRFGMRERIGDPVADRERFEATSPLKQAARIKNPLLLGYGGEDQRVPIQHGRRLYDAVRGHNPNVEWVEYRAEGHSWARTETQLDWAGRVERFLARNLA